jgi:NAD(P)-dependent dehydrogenase (short-subunit alcohol dehydrogenase family)
MELMNLFDLTGKNIAITAGHSYLGQAITKALRDFGATVFVLSRYEEKFNNVFSESYKKEQGGSILFQQCDISSTKSIQTAMQQIYIKGGSFDGLINNANYTKIDAHPLGLSDESWTYTVDGVLNSVYRCIREVTPYMKKSGGGSIVNISSMYGFISPDFSIYSGNPEMTNPPHYGAAKAGVIQMGRYFSQFLGGERIRVNTISPGAFPTKEIQQKKIFIQNLDKKTALGRIGSPQDIKGAAVYLISDASSYVTGHNLVVDGGWTASR